MTRAQQEAALPAQLSREPNPLTIGCEVMVSILAVSCNLPRVQVTQGKQMNLNSIPNSQNIGKRHKLLAVVVNLTNCQTSEALDPPVLSTTETQNAGQIGETSTR